MPIRLRCPGCRARLSIASRKAGQTINCPRCETEIPVPSETTIQEQKGAVKETPHATMPTEAANAPASLSRSSRKLQSATVPPESETDTGEDELLFRRPETDFEEMDLTPMVDVTFLLLIFFMITASFTIQKTLRFPRPQPEKEGVTQTPQRIEDFRENSVIVEINENNQIDVDGERVTDRSRLADIISRKMYVESPPKNEVTIQRHYFSSHELTVLVVDAAKTAQAQKIRMGIDPKSRPPD